MSRLPLSLAACLLAVLLAITLVPASAQSVSYYGYNGTTTCNNAAIFADSNATSLMSDGNYTTACIPGDEGESYKVACSSTSSAYFLDVYSDGACNNLVSVMASTTGNCDVLNNDAGFLFSLIVTCNNNPNGAAHTSAAATVIVTLLGALIATMMQ